MMGQRIRGRSLVLILLVLSILLYTRKRVVLQLPLGAGWRGGKEEAYCSIHRFDMRCFFINLRPSYLLSLLCLGNYSNCFCLLPVLKFLLGCRLRVRESRSRRAKGSFDLWALGSGSGSSTDCHGGTIIYIWVKDVPVSLLCRGNGQLKPSQTILNKWLLTSSNFSTSPTSRNGPRSLLILW